MRLSRILACGVALLLASPALAQPATKPAAKANAPTPAAALPKPVVSMEGITEYRLDNGLKVLLFPDQTKQTITVNITYLVGSRHEDYGETGMAHLLEHLVFKGTPRHPNIPQELTSHGARPNGTTWVDRTNYFETFSATDENLDWALDLEADRMVNSFIAKKDLESEMTVVRNEFESGENDPASVLEERVMSTAYLWHNYGKSTIGARADLENVPIERLQAFYKKYYQPDNAVLMVTGKFDPEKTLAKVVKYFAPIPRPARKLIETYTLDPTQDGEREVNLRRAGDVQLVGAAYHVCAGSHPDFAPIDVLTEAMGARPNGRLYKALVETKKASATYARTYQWREPGVILLGAQLSKEQSMPEAEKLLFETIESRATPFTAEEIERAKTTLLKNIELQLNQSDFIGLELSEWIAMGDWRLFFLNRERLKKVSVDDVNRVAAYYLKSSNRTLGRFYPTAQPDRVEIPKATSASLQLAGFKLDTKVAEGEAFDPSPANIESRTTRSKASATTPAMALLSKKTRGASVVARVVLRIGNEASLKNNGVVADLAADMLTRGTTSKTRQQVKDEFDKLKAQVNVFGQGQIVQAQVTTIRENLPAVLRLMNECLRQPSFPADEFATLVQENLTQIEEQRSEPQFQGSITLQRHIRPYAKDDVRYVMTADEMVAAYKGATLEQVKAFYAANYGAGAAQVSVVGDFDATEISKLATELWGGWTAKESYVRLPALTLAQPALNEKIVTPDKANAFFAAGLVFAVRDDDPDYAALTLGNFMLGGGFLNSRLATRIRQKEGLSYGVGSQLQISALDKDATFGGFAIYAPENVDKLEAAFKDELQKALAEGFTEQEIKEAKSGWLQGRSVQRAQDGGLAAVLTNYLFIDRTLQWDADLEKKVEALTPQQIKDAFNRHLDLKRLSIVKAGNFK